MRDGHVTGVQTCALPICIEEEISELDEEEKQMFLEELGIQESGLDQLVRAAYDLLDLGTYFTAGEKEVRAWTFRKGMTAPQARSEERRVGKEGRGREGHARWPRDWSSDVCSSDLYRRGNFRIR